MIIDGFQKLTLLDYPSNISCIIFTRGCNLKCPFCHNSPLVLNKSKSLGEFSEEEIFEYLIKRKKVLDGVVISGGEPLLQKDIKEFITKIKNLGYKVKLDTNGTSPDKLKELIDNNLIDYVAMDIKNSFDKYPQTCGKKINIDLIKQSINILKNSNIDYEFRTTIVKEFHTLKDIEFILKLISGSKYYIQNFEDGENVINSNLHSFTNDELHEINNKLINKFSNYSIRNLDT